MKFDWFVITLVLVAIAAGVKSEGRLRSSRLAPTARTTAKRRQAR